MSDSTGYPFPTLPDYLAPGLKLVFVGINPGLYSLRQGHYFARSTSRFWPAFSRSRLSEPIRTALEREVLGPQDDAALLRFGIGFTDVVKIPSRNAGELRPSDFAEWTPRLLKWLQTFQPSVVCFHGVTAYRAFLIHALGVKPNRIALGAQVEKIGIARLFVVPNPSPANAHFRLEDQVTWYDHLADFLEHK